MLQQKNIILIIIFLKIDIKTNMSRQTKINLISLIILALLKKRNLSSWLINLSIEIYRRFFNIF